MRRIYSDDSWDLVELAPSCRVISMSTPGWNTVHRYYLSFPYVQFYSYKRAHCMWVTFSKESVNPKTIINLPFLPNIDSGFNLCWGHDEPNNRNIEAKISHFWNSKFYRDSDWYGVRDLSYVSYKGKMLQSYYNWQLMTIEDGNFITQAIWRSNFLTYKDVVERICGPAVGLRLQKVFHDPVV